ncbi:MAG: hypothetical protein QOG73_1040, partial [Acetobacteraceae bacterium]|nr:hypothetical protein [Acetobacteraceae bacterium]
RLAFRSSEWKAARISQSLVESLVLWSEVDLNLRR